MKFDSIHELIATQKQERFEYTEKLLSKLKEVRQKQAMKEIRAAIESPNFC